MSSTPLDDLFDRYVRQCCCELFAAYGVSLVADGQEQAEKQRYGLAGIIGFTGDQVKGSLLLASTVEMIAATFPVKVASGASTEDALVDWTGELSNQLLGRIKNRLLPHGVSFALSIPVSLSGADLEQSRLVKPSLRRFALRGNGGAVHICLEAQLRGDLQLRTEPVSSTEVDVVHEGDMLLF